MNPTTVSQPTRSWAELNHQYLMASIAQIVSLLQSEASPPPPPDPLNPPAAIDQLCYLFGLTAFERAIVLLCAGMELHSGLSPLISNLLKDSQRAYPTFNLALSYLPQGHWSAITPESPLRRWSLIELGGSPTLTYSPLRINERILHFLLGDTQLDPQLLGIVTSLARPTAHILPPSYQQQVEEIQGILQNTESPPIIQLCGYENASKRTIALAVCQQLGYGLLSLNADILPSDFEKLNLVRTLWEREAILTGSLLLLDCDSLQETGENSNPSHQQSSTIAYLIENCQRPLFILSRDRRSTRQRSVMTFEVTQPTTIEQRHLWRQTLEATTTLEPTEIERQVTKLVSHFNLSHLAIQTISTQVFAQGTGKIADRLWTTCLSYARPRLEELTQPIRSQAVWEDLVLPEKEKQTLQTLAAQVRQRSTVYEQWGFARQGERGLGISALFAGASGTGKTLAAEVLANALHLDLYRIDLSSVVSKYIGETEKNLRRIFDAAELGGAILLFDEADALFGKRSEVKDSHDRYANMEVAYLLQRMEAYRGLAILTTNLKASLDQAFLRRLRFVVQFPFPDATQRAEIWQRVFPKETPTENLSYQKLAKLNVAGGNIRNIALNAAFLAADAGVPIQMPHLLQAAQSEYIKLERPMTEAEIKGWDVV
ncbi:MAG: ATP-binding protein [Leptolyngbyaceae cyanobacterium bins.59]|nr:ATP-binding protein [Leptolyngbyaceae cyanobacterium bins.59]